MSAVVQSADHQIETGFAILVEPDVNDVVRREFEQERHSQDRRPQQVVDRLLTSATIRSSEPIFFS
jgi:hypothetical protein